MNWIPIHISGDQLDVIILISSLIKTTKKNTKQLFIFEPLARKHHIKMVGSLWWSFLLIQPNHSEWIIKSGFSSSRYDFSRNCQKLIKRKIISIILIHSVEKEGGAGQMFQQFAGLQHSDVSWHKATRERHQQWSYRSNCCSTSIWKGLQKHFKTIFGVQSLTVRTVIHKWKTLDNLAQGQIT